jgi:hypothetical protein
MKVLDKTSQTEVDINFPHDFYFNKKYKHIHSIHNANGKQYIVTSITFPGMGTVVQEYVDYKMENTIVTNTYMTLKELDRNIRQLGFMISPINIFIKDEK